MKILYLVCFIVLSSMVCLAQSLERDTIATRTIAVPKGLIKIYPLQYGEVYAAYEKVRNPKQTVEFGISYIYRSFTTGEWLPEEKPAAGGAVRVAWKNYITSRSKGKFAPLRFYHGPQFMYKLIGLSFDHYEIDDHNHTILSPHRNHLIQHIFSAQYMAGYQDRIAGSHFTYSIFGGVGMRMKLLVPRYREGAAPDYNPVIGRRLMADENYALKWVPSVHVGITLGYLL